MPIYEFYCEDCNTIFNFFSKTINTSKQPVCPKCRKRKLERQVSVFSMSGNKSEETEGFDDLPIDERKMENALSSLAAEAGNLDESDPRQAAGLMRKFSKMTGIGFGDGMEQVLNRLESGEDPTEVEKDMESLMDGEESFVLQGQKGSQAKRRLPVRDTKLYDM